MNQQLSSALSLVILVVAFYFLLIRPQQQRQKQHRELMASLAVGDRVITVGGVHGTIRTLDEDRAGVEVAPGIVIEFDRGAIARSIKDEGAKD